jgi:hypothetical protein
VAAGLVMILIGLFFILRTVTKDSSGKNLVDYVTSL